MVRRRMGLWIAALATGALSAAFHPAGAIEVGDERALRFHIDQADVEAGIVDARTLIAAGGHLFTARFTAADGAGRPGATGSGLPTRRPLVNARPFLRTSGPDANSCAGCHHQPAIGGGGEFVSNVFVGAQEREPVLLSVSPEFSAERGTTEMNGAGLIELLAREMTAELHAIRDAAVKEAKAARASVRRPLVAKGVDFGYLVALPTGEVDAAGAAGIDKDLVIRPWSQKGVVTSLRTFTITALNHHHGMQAVERYGVRRTGARDFDRDGVEDELTVGDITALILFQATLQPPRQILPADKARRRAVARGEKVFGDTGCAGCHRPALVLRNPVYTEPGPYNLEGTLRLGEASRPVAADLTALPWEETLKRTPEGGVIVRAFTDLKRHRIADDEEPFFRNEIVTQGFAPTDEFLTRRLWGVGNTGPYGHRGDVTTLHEVILYHGGEARAAKLAYKSLSETDRTALVEFLKSLRVVPDRPAVAESNFDDETLVAGLEGLWRTRLARANTELRELLARAEAATRRTEHNAQRAQLLALRVAHEAERADAATDATAALPPVPTLALPPALTRRDTSQIDGLSDLLGYAERARVAAERARTYAAKAVGGALFAHPGDTEVPVGRLDPSMVSSQLVSSLGAGDGLGALKSLAAWCENLAFVSEQMAQQAALAAARAEAQASLATRTK